jgi:protein TonB
MPVTQAASTEATAPAAPRSAPIIGDATVKAAAEAKPEATSSPPAETRPAASEAKPEPAATPAAPEGAPMVRSANAEPASVQPEGSTPPAEAEPKAKTASSEQQPPRPQAKGKLKSKPMTLGTGLGSSKALFDAARRNGTGYGARVRAAIGSHKPKAVGARGSATVSFAIGPFGGLQSLRISRSSGKAELDQAALASVRNAAPFAPPPAKTNPSYSIQIFFR